MVCGAGIAGVATAFQLVVEQGMRNVKIVDPLPPLTLTSDKSTECYRNWWPNAPMVGLMNRSIDLLEDYDLRSGHAFHLTRAGLSLRHCRPRPLVGDGSGSPPHH